VAGSTLGSVVNELSISIQMSDEYADAGAPSLFDDSTAISLAFAPVCDNWLTSATVKSSIFLPEGISALTAAEAGHHLRQLWSPEL